MKGLMRTFLTIFLEKITRGRRKRNILNPRYNLNESLLVGPKGIPNLRKLFKNYVPDQREDPYVNLRTLMKKYEHWAHLMFPSSKFEDVVSRCENLGKKRRVKVYMIITRMDQLDNDEEMRDEPDRRVRKEKNLNIIDDGKDDGEEIGEKHVERREDEDFEAEFRSVEEEERRKAEERLAQENEELLNDFDSNDW
ncbi:unnamed protein product [Caenorhabditis auriculariae]|uniref:TIMELESS-interacting protein n=1 Tax=Caenorhabditis auriculariae TaxID=2777116 RepID=A0A8S1GMR7_9PELO|nr:unnamed protein product [Caenorhabditis auriculariae]